MTGGSCSPCLRLGRNPSLDLAVRLDQRTKTFVPYFVAAVVGLPLVLEVVGKVVPFTFSLGELYKGFLDIFLW